jgi:hypothetical protein
VEDRRPGLAAFAAANAFVAFAGAVGLVGGGLDFGAEIDARLPFDSLVLAGCALAAIVGVPSLVLALAAWRGDPRTAACAVATGVALIGWIAVQLVFIRTFSWFQPTYVGIGVGLVVAGRRSRHGVGPARRPTSDDRSAELFRPS